MTGLEALAADHAGLSAAGAAAEDALCLQQQALAILAEGWGGESGSAAVDLVQQECAQGVEIVAELQRVAGEVALLRDRLADESAPAAFDIPVAQPPMPPVPPAPAQTAAAPQAWAPAAMPLPDIGGALLGLVAQIADSLGPDLPVDTLIDVPADVPVDVPVESAPDSADPPQPEDDPPPVPVPVTASDPAPPAADPPLAAPPPPVNAEATADPDALLAAESPPPGEAPPVNAAADPDSDPATPCEIAADELPQVGG